MLSRHFFREKVLQSLYAYVVIDDRDMLVFEKNMLNAMDKLYDLFIYQLSIIIEIADTANQQTEDAELKYFPAEDDRNGNIRFLKNKVLQSFTANRDFRRKRERLKINWSEEKDIIRKIYNTFKAKDVYKKYVSVENPSFEEDCQVIAALFKFAVNYPALVDKFIEKNLYWEDDFFQIAQLSYQMFRSIEENFDEYTALPEFFEKEADGTENEDKLFAVELFRKVILHEDKLTKLIKNRISKWEYERIAAIDVILIKMAVIEFMYFPSIPVKVTINEYIELSKEYSTEKSKTFVNAILDKIVVDLKNEGLLNKSGRGLINA